MGKPKLVFGIFFLLCGPGCSESKDAEPSHASSTIVTGGPVFQVEVDGEKTNAGASSIKARFFSDGSKSTEWGYRAEVGGHEVSFMFRDGSHQLFEKKETSAELMEDRSGSQLMRHELSDIQTFEVITPGKMFLRLSDVGYERHFELRAHTEGAKIDVKMVGPVGISCKVPPASLDNAVTFEPEVASTGGRELLVTDREKESEECKQLMAQLRADE